MWSVLAFFVLKAKAQPKPQTKPQQVDGNRVQERMEGVEAATGGSRAPLIALHDSEEKAD